MRRGAEHVLEVSIGGYWGIRQGWALKYQTIAPKKCLCPELLEMKSYD